MTHNAYNVYIYYNTSHYVNYRNSYNNRNVGISTLYMSIVYAYHSTHKIWYTPHNFFIE